MRKKISLLLFIMIVTVVVFSGCGNNSEGTNSRINPDILKTEEENRAEQLTDIPTDPPTQLPRLSENCDMILCTGTDKNNYYELVSNKTESYQSTTYSFGVIKNNEWLIEMSEDFPFINDDGWWRGRDSSYDRNGPSEFIYLGHGVFYYAKPEMIYKPETGVLFEVAGLAGFSPYKDEFSDLDYTKLINDNSEILTRIVQDGHMEFSYINMDTGEVKSIPLELTNINNTLKIGLLSDGLFYAYSFSPFSGVDYKGFYDLNGHQIINLREYKTSDLGDYMFHDGKFTMIVKNDVGNEFYVTLNKKGVVIGSDKTDNSGEIDATLEERLNDTANLLTDSESTTLNSELDSVSNQYYFDIVIVTVDSLNGKTDQEYADDYYDDNNYGFGSEKDGVLLLVAMKERKMYITTTGRGISLLDEEYINKMLDVIQPDLSSEKYYTAFQSYVDLVKEKLDS